MNESGQLVERNKKETYKKPYLAAQTTIGVVWAAPLQSRVSFSGMVAGVVVVRGAPAFPENRCAKLPARLPYHVQCAAIQVLGDTCGTILCFVSSTLLPYPNLPAPTRTVPRETTVWSFTIENFVPVLKVMDTRYALVSRYALYQFH
jgi:hypothetical protein